MVGRRGDPHTKMDPWQFIISQLPSLTTIMHQVIKSVYYAFWKYQHFFDAGGKKRYFFDDKKISYYRSVAGP